MSVKAFGDSVGFLPTQESFFYEGIKGVEDKVEPEKTAGIRSYYWLTSLVLRIVGVKIVQARDVSGKVHYFSRASFQHFLGRHKDPTFALTSDDTYLDKVSEKGLTTELERIVADSVGNNDYKDLARNQINFYYSRAALKKAKIPEKLYPPRTKNYERKIKEIEKKLGLRI